MRLERVPHLALLRILIIHIGIGVDMNTDKHESFRPRRAGSPPLFPFSSSSSCRHVFGVPAWVAEGVLMLLPPFQSATQYMPGARRPEQRPRAALAQPEPRLISRRSANMANSPPPSKTIPAPVCEVSHLCGHPSGCTTVKSREATQAPVSSRS